MKKNKMFFISIAGIAIIFIALLGFSYGFFLTRINGNTNTNSILATSSDLSLKYEEGQNSNIELVDFEPGVKASKTFSVTNDGDSIVDAYGVYLEDIINTFSRTEDLKYKLTCVASKGTEELGTCGSVSNDYPTKNSRIIVNSIDKDVTHTYTFELEYVYLDDVNQSEDMGKTLGGKIQIYAESDVTNVEGTVTGATTGDYILLESDNKTSQIDLTDNSYILTGVGVGSHTIKVMNKSTDGTITNKGSKEIIIRKAQEARIDQNTKIIYIDEETEKIPINITSINTTLTLNVLEPVGKPLLAEHIIASYGGENNITQVTNFGTEVAGLYKAEDNYGISYYYRGSVEDNYVIFGKTADGYVDKPLGYVKAEEGFDPDTGEYLGYVPVGDKLFNTLSECQDYYYTYCGVKYEKVWTEGEPLRWKIVRINGDSSIRLVLDDIIAKDYYTDTYNDMDRIAYIYSRPKSDVDYWYNTNLTPYDSYISDTLFCNDIKLYDINNTYDDPKYYYAGMDRMDTYKPSLVCSSLAYTKSDTTYGNGALTYSIGLLTADEVLMGGSYLKEGTQSYTMTLKEFNSYQGSGSGIYMYTYGVNGLSHDYYGNELPMFGEDSWYGVRPVINIKDTNKYSGLGTSISPYVINTD